MNYTARGTIGNRSRTGMPKPPGSGRPVVIAAEKRFTLWTSIEDRLAWDAEARRRNQSTAEFVRETMADHLERLQHAREKLSRR